MDKIKCQKCGGEISNDFNQTLSFCTNCGSGINLLQDEKTLSSETNAAFSPTPVNYNANPIRKSPNYTLGCLGLSFGAALLGAIGIFGYWWWLSSPRAENDSGDTEYYGKITVPKSQTVRFMTALDEPESLDPQRSSPSESVITNALFDGLVEFNNQNADLTASLATKWENNADATVWTFHLRREAKWSDGKPITASDFVYSWRRALNPDLKNRNAFLLYHIKNAERFNTKQAKAEDVGVLAIDDYTLQVTLEKPTPFFIKTITDSVFRPVPQQTVEKYGVDWMKPENIVSSGAFKLVEWTAKKQIVAERNPQFWDNANTKLEKIIFLSTQINSAGEFEPADPLEFYRNGELDASLRISSRDDKSSLTKKDYFSAKGNSIEFISVNTTVKPFDDARVRRALSLAIDREKLKEKELSNYPTTSFTPEIKGYENAKDIGYNPVEARRLLEEAGFPEGRGFPEIEYIYNTNERNRVLAQFVQEQWQQELGVKVKLVSMEFREFLKKRNALDYKGVARNGWVGDFLDPHTFLSLPILEKNGNGTGWIDKKYVEMIEKSNLETDEAERYRMLQEAEKYLLEHQPVIPLYVGVSGILCKPYVKNLLPNPLRQINWREVYIDPNWAAK